MGYIVVAILMRIFNREDIRIIENTVQNEQFAGTESIQPFENDKFMIGVAVTTS